MASRIDLHMHSAASDGTDSPAGLIETVKRVGIRIFSLTDHDTVEGVAEIAGRVPEGVVFLPGIEFSCTAPSGKCHILGYGCDMRRGAFQEILERVGALRRTKLETRLAFLEERGIRLPEEEIARLRGMPSAGKPHLANLMVKYGYAASREDAIRDTLNLCRTGSTRIPADTAIRAILASGGIPVWAHPLGGEGERETPEDQFQAVLSELLGCGLKGLECYYSKYPLARCRRLEGIAQEHRLLVSGGSDYHGANKKVAPGSLNADGAAVEIRTFSPLLEQLGCREAS